MMINEVTTTRFEYLSISFEFLRLGYLVPFNDLRIKRICGTLDKQRLFFLAEIITQNRASAVSFLPKPVDFNAFLMDNIGYFFFFSVEN